MKAICCVDTNWGIGKDNELLYHISSDLHHFKELTIERTIIMGSRTLASLPHGQPLPRRRNLVLSTNPALDRINDIQRFATIKELLDFIDQDSKQGENEFWVIGGASVYEQLLPFCNEVHVTKVADSSKQPDRFFPNLDTAPDWQLSYQSDPKTENDLSYTLCIYKRV